MKSIGIICEYNPFHLGHKKQIDIIAAAEFIESNTAISVYRGEPFTQLKAIAAKAADEMLRLKGIETSFVLYQQDGAIHISARSEGDANVQLIMEQMGGGGHRSAAGTQLEGVTLDEAYAQLMQNLQQPQQ